MFCVRRPSHTHANVISLQITSLQHCVCVCVCACVRASVCVCVFSSRFVCISDVLHFIWAARFLQRLALMWSHDHRAVYTLLSDSVLELRPKLLTINSNQLIFNVHSTLFSRLFQFQVCIFDIYKLYTYKQYDQKMKISHWCKLRIFRIQSWAVMTSLYYLHDAFWLVLILIGLCYAAKMALLYTAVQKLVVR